MKGGRERGKDGRREHEGGETEIKEEKRGEERKEGA